MDYKNLATTLFKEAGIEINGTGPHDIQVHNDQFYKKLFKRQTVGLGESYMDSWWDCQAIDKLFHRLCNSKLAKQRQQLRSGFSKLKPLVSNPGSKRHAFKIGEYHYDLGNDLYNNMLGSLLTYSCGYWKDADSLDEAQKSKIELICKKLKLSPGAKVLDIGCGWGSFLKYAAEKYSAKGVGITVSKEQIKLGQELCKNLPVDIRLQDYRDVDEKFDYVVSVGMFEHVGYKNYRTYMKKVHDILDNNGLFLLHTIAKNDTANSVDPWLVKYIFPGGMLPSISQICDSSEGLFVVEDLHNFGADYDKTLMAWYNNFKNNWDRIKLNYSDRFYRMWKYFLLSSAGAFRARNLQVYQVVFSKNGVLGGYDSIR